MARPTSVCSRSTSTRDLNIRNTSRCCRPGRIRRPPSPRASSRSRWRRIRNRRRWRLRCRRGILAERLRRRARERQEGRLQDRLRQGLSAPPTHRLHAGRARDAGGQCRPRRRLLLSGRLRRHRQVGERNRVEAEDVRRRDGRSADDGVQGQAEGQAQRHRQLRDLGAGREEMYKGTKSSSTNIRSARRPPASIRSATISAAGAMRNSKYWATP